VNLSLVGQEVVHPQSDEDECNEYFGVEEHMIAKDLWQISFLGVLR
jgi:hypothetical protein